MYVIFDGLHNTEPFLLNYSYINLEIQCLFQ